MANWQDTEGVKPEKEEYTGLRGIILFLIIAYAMYYALLVPFFDVPANSLLHEYGISSRMEGWDAFFFGTYKILKFFASIVGAVVVRNLINMFIRKQNEKIGKENETILANNANAIENDEYEAVDLLSRLQKGKKEVKKYEQFFDKRDKYQFFYNWKKKHTVLTIIGSLFITPYIASFIIYVVAIICNIVFGLLFINNPAGLNSVSEWLDPLLITISNIMWIGFTVAIALGIKPFVKKMQEKADALQLEDERNGYTAALENVIPDVPERYRKEKLMNALIKLVKKHNYGTVQEAVNKYEYNLKLKKGIAFGVAALAAFGVFNGINNAMNSSLDDFNANMRASTNSILKDMDKSKADSMARSQMYQQEKSLRNTWGNQYQQAQNLYSNAARFAPNSNEYRQAIQHANALQRQANETRRQYNNLFR